MTAVAFIPMEKISSYEQLHTFSQKRQLFAILDACEAPHVLEKVEELQEIVSDQVQSLFAFESEEDFSAFAPYLLHVTPEHFEWTLGALGQEGGGIFVVSDVPMEALYRHFRRFLLVLAPNKEEMYFRFYDPRVLPHFLLECSNQERRDIFGPVLGYGTVLEDEIMLITEAPEDIPLTSLPRPPREGLFQMRNAHFVPFAKCGEVAFENGLVEHLREFHTDLVDTFPDDTLIEMVRPGIARARKYGLYSEADLTAFAAIMFEIAPNFDSHPFIRSILTDYRLLGTEKIDALVKRVPNNIWAEAERRYDAKAWFPELMEEN